MKLIMVSILLAVLFLGCTSSPPQANNTTSTPPVIKPQNNTSLVTPPGTSTLPPGYTVDLGDNVSVWYALWVNGTLLDTNNATLANESGIYNPARKYLPFNFTVQFKEGVIDGFIIGTIGMSVNETLYFNVDPDRGYGPWDPKKILVIPRYYNFSLMETVPRSFFEQKGINVTEGAGFETQYGLVFIDSFDEENVTIIYALQKGQSLVVNGIPQKVVGGNNLTVTIEYLLGENETYRVPDPDTGVPKLYTVVSKSNETITLDSNHPLANETLRFRVTLIDVVPG